MKKKFTTQWKLNPYNHNEVLLGNVTFKVPSPYKVSNNGSCGPNYNAILASHSVKMYNDIESDIDWLISLMSELLANGVLSDSMKEDILNKISLKEKLLKEASGIS